MKSKKQEKRYSFERKPPFLIQIYGRRRVVFEACKRVRSYTQQEIVLEGDGIVKIKGERLVLRELGFENLAADGEIHALIFKEDGGALS